MCRLPQPAAVLAFLAAARQFIMYPIVLVLTFCFVFSPTFPSSFCATWLPLGCPATFLLFTSPCVSAPDAAPIESCAAMVTDCLCVYGPHQGHNAVLSSKKSRARPNQSVVSSQAPSPNPPVCFYSAPPQSRKERVCRSRSKVPASNGITNPFEGGGEGRRKCLVFPVAPLARLLREAAEGERT
jgi:hypothetical protein